MTLSRRSMIKINLMAGSALALRTPFLLGEPRAATRMENPDWFWFPGGALSFPAKRAQSGESVPWILSEANPKEGSVLHSHTHQDETTYVLTGTFEFEVGDRSVIGGPGLCVHGPRQVAHRWTNVGDEPGRLMTTFTPTGLEKVFRSLAVPVQAPHERPEVDMAVLGPRIQSAVAEAGLLLIGGTRYPHHEG